MADTRFFVRATPRYFEDSKAYGCKNVYERFKRDIEEHQKPGTIRNEYFKNYFKKQHENFRSIFYEYKFKVGSQEVFCYLAVRVLKRGEADYERFINETPEADEDRWKIAGLNQVDFEALKKELTEALQTPTEKVEVPPLSNEERQFMNPSIGISATVFQDGVYESKEWMDAVNIDFSHSHTIAEAIKGFVDKNLAEQEVEDGFHELKCGVIEDKILCAKLRNGQNWSWFLLALGNDDLIQKARQKYQNCLQHDDLASKCLRAYPYSMLDADEDLWREMELDKNSNFILSNEEIKIVQGGHDFPLFISGRAGSGKSTMLQYLFADYLLRYCQIANIKPPVYLSYSSGLVDNAKRLSTSLFKKNHLYLQKLNEIGKNYAKDIEPQLSKVFFVFQDLVKDFISQKSPKIIQDRFAPNCYVSYDKFRQLWEKKFNQTKKARKEYGPALSWHVIRTYIKGWNSEAYMEPDEYADIGGNNMSVSQDTFRLVYDKVWMDWYSKLQEEKNLWDDQDLVRYCLSPDDNSNDLSCATERFSAVFCDESQDFTRIETDFILRISLFYYRSIPAYLQKQLPFVFVGDEFQTLNPTGFSWDSLRSYFTEKILTSGKGAPDPVILTKNYRSTAPIVKLANRLQLLREVRFKPDTPSAPQIPYFADSEGASVYCLDPEKPEVWKKLKEMEVKLIVPCADGQSVKEYIEGTNISKMIDFDKNGAPKNISIYNPIQAKGLEYTNIAIYGFDDEVDSDLKIKGLKKWLNNSNPPPDSETKGIELKYFLNNAYVSATRAKANLFILSKFNDQSFWAFAFSSPDISFKKEVREVEKLMLKRVNERSNKSEWQSKDGETLLGYIIQGDISEISKDIKNTEDIAKSDEDRGKDLKDSFLMFQAAARYRERGDSTGELKCEAFAYEFDQKYFEAAENFVAADMYDAAVKNYWRACASTDNILSVLKKIAGLAYCSRTEAKAARMINNKSVALHELKLLLDELCKTINNKEDENSQDKKFAIETSQVWANVLQMLLDKVPQATPAQKNDVETILGLCESLKQHRILFGKNELPKMACDADLIEEAISLWDSYRLTEYPQEYHKAKCEILQYPQNIVHRKLSGDSDWQSRVIEDYRDDHGTHEITDDASKKVLDQALFDIGTPEEQRNSLLRLLDHANGIEEANDFLNEAEKKKLSLAKPCFDALFRLKWGGLDQWNWDEKSLPYESPSLNNLVKTICKIKEIRTDKFASDLNKNLNEPRAKVIDVMKRLFGSFQGISWNPLLFIEIGFIMEQKGNYLNAARYYEWAQKHVSGNFKRDFAIRWIVCKEKQADNTKDEASASESRENALSERKRLGIAANATLPSRPKFEHWQWAFNEVLQQNAKLMGQKNSEPKDGSGKGNSPAPIEPTGNKNENPTVPPNGNDTGATEHNGTNPVEVPENGNSSSRGNSGDGEETNGDSRDDLDSNGNGNITNDVPPVDQPPIQTTPNDAPVTFERFELNLAGYVIRYLQKENRSEFTINYVTKDQDLRIKFKNGKISGDDDFEIRQDGRLIQSESRSETPFKIEVMKDAVRLCDIKTNVSFLFPFSSSNHA